MHYVKMRKKILKYGVDMHLNAPKVWDVFVCSDKHQAKRVYDNAIMQGDYASVEILGKCPSCPANNHVHFFDIETRPKWYIKKWKRKPTPYFIVLTWRFIERRKEIISCYDFSEAQRMLNSLTSETDNRFVSYFPKVCPEYPKGYFFVYKWTRNDIERYINERKLPIT